MSHGPCPRSRDNGTPGAWGSEARASSSIGRSGRDRSRRTREALRRGACGRGVSFAVARGETFGILGPNGAGKTTTLEMIEGLTRPDARLDRDPRRAVWPNPTRVQSRIGVQLQKNALFENLTAAELLDLFAQLLRRPARGPRAAPAGARRPRGEGRLAGAPALGRAAAAPRDRPRARARPRDRVPRRADHRPRPAGAAQPLGRDPRGRRRAAHRRAHDALPRRGRDAVRPRRDHGRRAASSRSTRRRR